MSTLFPMEVVERTYFETTGWRADDLYESLLATPRRLLKFPLPTGLLLLVATQATPHSASALSLLSNGNIQGLLAYCYALVPLPEVLTLKDGIADYPGGLVGGAGGLPLAVLPSSVQLSLYYGRMYFPGSALEAMYIHRWLAAQQLVAKCVLFPKHTAATQGAVTLSWQTLAPRFLREFLYSTVGGLVGFRYLHHWTMATAPLPYHKPSTLSAGTEVWYGMESVAPGASVGLRFNSAILLALSQRRYTLLRQLMLRGGTGPLLPYSVTLTANPVIGQMLTLYAIAGLNPKSHLYLALCYDFNIYSYKSDFSLGVEYYRRKQEMGEEAGVDGADGVATTISKTQVSRHTLPQRTLHVHSRDKANEDLHELIKFEEMLHQQQQQQERQERQRPQSPFGLYTNFDSLLKAAWSVEQKACRLMYMFKWHEAFVVSWGLDWKWGARTPEVFVPFRPLSWGVLILYSS